MTCRFIFIFLLEVNKIIY